jgi:hypothetical protein
MYAKTFIALIDNIIMCLICNLIEVATKAGLTVT